MHTPYIVDAVRTPIGSIGGTLKNTTPETLATIVIKALLERGADKDKIDHVILGHCRQSSDNPNIARLAALYAGIPDDVPAFTVMRQCASGMTALWSGCQNIMLGESGYVVAGGTESMSTAPFYLRNARYGLGTGNTQLLDSIVEAHFHAQPPETYGKFAMGATAENIAEQMNISREDQDKFSLLSQQKAHAAIASGRFKDEIVPVVIPQRKGDPVVFDTDEFPRETSLEKLAKLKPAFREGGTVTAGSSSGRNDGAAALLLMSEEQVKANGVTPMAKVIGHGVAAVDPRVMGLGPIEATRRALKMANLTLDDIGLFELNEAFAAQAIGCIRELGLENRMDVINVNGGAIALGHPVGDSGARITVTLVHEMKKRGVKYGLATLCIAGGMGEAVILELA